MSARLIRVRTELFPPDWVVSEVLALRPPRVTIILGWVVGGTVVVPACEPVFRRRIAFGGARVSMLPSEPSRDETHQESEGHEYGLQHGTGWA